MHFPLSRLLMMLVVLFAACRLNAQQSLLLNGGFEDINTCSEYNSECGVEGWFYLKEVQAQMLSHDEDDTLLGRNSYLIYQTWKNDPRFVPVIGALLPCRMQAGHEYIFRGTISVKLNPRLIFQPAVSVGPRFYVPGRKYAATQSADTISNIEAINGTNFFCFTYRYTATGDEDYLTFGDFVREDTTTGKQRLTGVQTVAMTLDNFELIPVDKKEGRCDGYNAMKTAIYDYNFRHREMDYPLFATGQLKIILPADPVARITKERVTPAIIADTLRLGDLSFHFNRSDLKDSTRLRLTDYFSRVGGAVDSIIIEGHTDSLGNEQYNLNLSMSRCKSVAQWLTGAGVTNEERTRIIPFGKTRPIASNATTAGRARNRRVELIIYWQKQPD